MKGDFSRLTFDRRKHYNGVLMQQGRVLTDADWNEQEAINRRRAQIETRDVIGPCGGPEDNAGFAISISGDQLRIGAGRYYVDGRLCENDVDGLSYDAQPDWLNAPSWTELAAKANASTLIAYLDVWERHITALDDGRLREVALTGPDTASRIKIVWQVRVLPVEQTDTAATQKDLLKKREQIQKKLDELTAAGGNPQDIAKLESELFAIDTRLAQLARGAGCDGPFKEWDALVANPDRKLNARTQAPQDPSGPCVVPPTAGYRRLENQLYRVEVHKPGAIGAATFKWSRDNGSVVTSIEKISGRDVTVHDLGPDDVLGFASGEWIEISDDRNELDGQPGQLLQIDSVNTSLRRITLTAAPTPLAGGADGVDRLRHPKLRRWDQTGNSATSDGVATTGSWLGLEDGVEVQFSNGPFRSGDYWLIPARTATGEIEWPPFAVPNTSPEPQPPRGIAHHYCRLALLTLGSDGKEWHVDDCRKLFPPITEPCCEPNSLHVVATNWRNDDLFPAANLARDGLRIRLDTAPDPHSLTNDTVLVAIEVPYTVGDRTNNSMVQRVYVRGNVSRDVTDARVIVWRAEQQDSSSAGTTATPAPAPTTPTPSPSTSPAGTTVSTPPLPVLNHPVFTVLNDAVAMVQPIAAAPRAAKTSRRAAARATADVQTAAISRLDTTSLRVRVTLKGHCVWNDVSAAPGSRVRFVDGQAFAQPAVRSDGSPRIALRFPTGHTAAASDFESWFLFGAGEQRTALQVTTVHFLNANNQPITNGDVTLPLDPTKKITMKAGEGIRSIDVTFNRAIAPASLGTANARSVFVELTTSAAGGVRVPGEVLVQSPTVVRFAAGSPLTAGGYRLVCLGAATGGAPAIAAADDNSALDGDFDGQAGGNFGLPFSAV